MKELIVCILISFCLTYSINAQYSKVEDITIESSELGQTREIMVHIPLGYHSHEYSFYNVIYVFDAQNRRFFDYVSSLAMLSKEADQGFIVVGIKATNIKKEIDGKVEYTYFRNKDFLPYDTKFSGGRFNGNIEAFSAFVRNELIPYIESNYRVLPGRTAIAHSLSASYLINTLVNDTELFDYYVAVSPNLDHDDHLLVKALRSINTKNLASKKYLYMSHADESSWGWEPSIKEAYALLKDTLANEQFKVTIESYPDATHMSTFIPSVSSALRTYLETIRPELNEELSEEKFEIRIRLKVPNEEDEVYLSGNQASLGDGKTNILKMMKVSPLIRELTLEVQDHVRVSFYLDGKSQAWLKLGEDGKTNYPMMIRPKEGGEYSFEVDSYMN